jgi:hypothetical protein
MIKAILMNTASVMLVSLLLFSVGCGVRGRPQAPKDPALIGRGKPSFTRSNQELAFPNVPSPEASPTPSENDGEGY